MTRSIQRELLIPQSRDHVWRSLIDPETLAAWMYPNNFEPRVGHQFAFQVPPNPQVGFEGLTVRCEVLECRPPELLAFSWSAAELTDSRVTFRLADEGTGTRVYFEHSGFDLLQRWGQQAFRGAEYGWTKMLGQFADLMAQSIQIPDSPQSATDA